MNKKFEFQKGGNYLLWIFLSNNVILLCFSFLEGEQAFNWDKKVFIEKKISFF